MKKIFIICVPIILLVILAIFWRTTSQRQNPETSAPVGLPTSSSVTPIAVQSRTIQTVSSGPITTNDFLAQPETKEDPANKGYYFLGNQPEVSNPYTIEYIAATDYFNISLLQEPIRQSRIDAENYMLEHLGLTKEKLCTLNYMLSVPDAVNSIYSDENLGFSFCPGAVVLP